MAGNTKDRIVTGLLCKRKVDGSPVVTHVIVREFQWESSKKARLGVYQYIGIKAWKNSASKARFIGFKWVYNSGDKESEYIQQYSFIDYIFDYPLPSVSEFTVKFSDGGYVFDDEEYLMKEIFPSLKRLTICGNREGGNDRKLIVPDGCEIVYKE